MPSIRQPTLGPICVHGASQNSEMNGICLPPPVNQSTPASGSSILPQPSSDFDTDQGDIIDNTIKQVAQSVNQMLLRTSQGNPISNLTPNNPPHDGIPNRQSILDQNPSDIHTQTHSQLILTDQPHLKHHCNPVTNFEHAKQIIMNIEALPHSPTLHNKILQELNLSGLCKYNSTQQAYLYKNSSNMVNCSYILVLLKQSTCYAITPDTHQWYRINSNKITDNHKIAFCNDLTVHMLPLPSGGIFGS